MKKLNGKLITALVIPLIGLAGLVSVKQYRLTYGDEVVLPIEGYDPRHLLAGHYLTYNVVYPVKNICPYGEGEGYVCIDRPGFYEFRPAYCLIYIKGNCTFGKHFNAGIERYYIPEDQALDLDQKVREKRAQVVLAVMPNGTAQVKDLIVDGKRLSESARPVGELKTE